MDNVINYIFESYDVMKNKSFCDHVKSFYKRPRSRTSFYRFDNTSIQTDREFSDSDRLSYIISMNIQDDVFSPNPDSPIGLEKRPLTSKEVLKLHLEGKIYDPFIKEKVNNIKSTNYTSYIRKKTQKANKVKSIPETMDKTDFTEVPGIESTSIDKRNTITFPANVAQPDDKGKSKMYSRALPPPPPLPPRNRKNEEEAVVSDNASGIKIADKVYLETDLDYVINTREEIKKQEEILFSIKRRFKHLAEIIAHVAPTENITRDLTSYEIDEVYHILNTQNELKPDFDKIYYLADSIQRNINKGIRDINNYYITCMNDHILFRYRIIEDLGRGCYGKVIRCYDHKHNKDCALKIIKSDRRYTGCFEHEVKMLLHLRRWYSNSLEEKKIYSPVFTNIVKSFMWRSHGVIVFNLYYADLYNAKLGRIKGEPLKVIALDLLNGLEFLKYANILHLDLKPENVFLVDAYSYNVKIGDFGLSKFGNRKQTDFNVQTCWYRSPEVLLFNQYSFEADLWSVGLIILELLTNRAVFRVKTDDELFYMMTEFMGKKPSNLINRNRNLNPTYLKIPIDKKIRFKEHLEKVENDMKYYIPFGLKDLLYGIMRWDPKERISLEKCKEIVNKYNAKGEKKLRSIDL